MVWNLLCAIDCIILCFLEATPKEAGGVYFSHVESIIFKNRSTEVSSSRSEINISTPQTHVTG